MKGTHLGYHAAEEEAARAYNKYLEDGIDPVKHHIAMTSQFTGVSWSKSKHKWEAQCKGTCLGCHSTEEAAARAYNVEAERVGRPPNVFPPGGAAGAGGGGGMGAGAGAGADAGAGAGSWRAAPKAPAVPNKMKRAAPKTPAAPRCTVQ
jgi:hypothetical protein